MPCIRWGDMVIYFEQRDIKRKTKMREQKRFIFLPETRRWLAIICIAVAVSWANFTPAAEEGHWSYSGEDGPQQWGDLSADYLMCSKGRNQSPIDLSGAVDADLEELILDYPNRGIVGEVNNGHTIQENLRPGNFITIQGQQYEAKQFHFHSPSEHRIDGKTFPLEIHVVHANRIGQLAVLGIMFDEGEENSTLYQLNGFRPEGLEPYTGPVDYNQLITSRDEYYAYNGSLTTPPCSEGVVWVVLKNPVTASREQIDRFHDAMGADTNRPIQPRNARTILE
jgi:carbonic anhydrase